MSEELCDELAKEAQRFRVKWICFGRTQTPWTGSAAGVTQSFSVHYNGPGIFVARGINIRTCNASTAGQSIDGRVTWSVFDMSQRLLLGPQSNFANTINTLYDNLDHGVALLSREYVTISVTSKVVATRIFPGMIWGVEFLFDERQ